MAHTIDHCIRAGDNIARYRPLLLASQLAFLGIGCLMWWVAAVSDTSFAAQDYGAMAYAIPAEAWAACLMFSSFTTWLGLIDPAHKFKIAIGAGTTAAMNAVLAYSVFASGGSFVIGAFALGLIIPYHCWICYEALARHG